MAKDLDLKAPYSQEELSKIGTAIGLLDTLVLKLEHETNEGQKILEECGNSHFGTETLLAFKFAFGIDLNDMRVKTIEKIEQNQLEIARIKAVREDTLEDPKLLIKIADFIDIIYQPNQE